jgi:hypothetical protein
VVSGQLPPQAIPARSLLFPGHMNHAAFEIDRQAGLTGGKPAKSMACWACGVPLPARPGRPRVVCGAVHCHHLRIKFLRLSRACWADPDGMYPSNSTSPTIG